jgi:hypothetical protein
MSAGTLSRLAGLVFVLAAVAGGVGASELGVQHVAGGSAVVADAGTTTTTAQQSDAPLFITFGIDWS